MEKQVTAKPSRGFGRAWKAGSLIGILAVVVFVWSGGFRRATDSATPPPPAAGFALPKNAERLTVSMTPMAPRIGVAGTMASEENIHLRSRISAYVSEVFVTAGHVVTQGQVLVTLDDRELTEQLAAARARFMQANSEFERAKELMTHKATTPQAFTAAEAAFQAEQANLQKVEVMLSYARIASPIDGIVTDRRIEVGDLAAPDQLLLTVYDPKRMRLEAPVPVRLVDRLALGQNVEAELDVPPGMFKGTVTEIVSAIDPLSRTQTVKVHLTQDEHRILPGTFGRLWVTEKSRPAILVPATAVYQVGQLAMVQLVRKDRAVRRLVQKGPAVDDQVEILAGLDAGDIILAHPVRAAE